MKKLLIFLVLFSSSQCFSQRAKNQEPVKINWLSIEKAQEYATKYDKKILIYFYRENCDYCETMKKQTLKDPEVIQFINHNFYPVSLDGRAKILLFIMGRNILISNLAHMVLAGDMIYLQNYMKNFKIIQDIYSQRLLSLIKRINLKNLSRLIN